MTDQRAPLVSVIVPVRNAQGTLADAVVSIQAQTETDWEALLIDDASTDGSARIIATMAAGDPRIRGLSLPVASGAAAARNAGLHAARGRFIAFLDADDMWRPGKLAAQIPVLLEGAGFVCSAYARIGADGSDRGVVRPPARIDYRTALGGNPIGCLTAIYDTARFGKVPMPPLQRRQDYALWLTLLRRGGPAVGLPEILADYRITPGSLSSNKLAAARATWTVLRRHEGLPLPVALRSFAAYGIGALGRRLP